MLEGQVFFFFRQAANCKLMNRGVTCTLFGQDYSWKTGWKTCLMSYALYSSSVSLPFWLQHSYFYLIFLCFCSYLIFRYTTLAYAHVQLRATVTFEVKNINFSLFLCAAFHVDYSFCVESFFCLPWNKELVLTDMRVNARFISRWTFPLRLMASVIGRQKRTGSCVWLLNHVLRESLMLLLKQSMSSCNRKWPSYFL